MATWLIATGGVFGWRLGRYFDDYWHCTLDPVTRGVARWVIDLGYFQRPLFHATLPAVTSIGWDRDWPGHVVQALTHGLVSLALYGLLRRLRLSRGASGVAALLFLIHPSTSEAQFWIAAWPTW